MRSACDPKTRRVSVWASLFDRFLPTFPITRVAIADDILEEQLAARFGASSLRRLGETACASGVVAPPKPSLPAHFAAEEACRINGEARIRAFRTPRVLI